MTTDASWVEEMPSVYDRGLGPALFGPCAVEVAQRVAALRPRRVLELAAGTGQLTRELLRALPHAEVVATDLNESMVDWARERVPGATWRQADAQRLYGVADASCDVVVCQFGVMFFPDRVGAFREVRRVLVPGGTTVVAVWDVLEGSTFASALVAALGELWPEDPPDFVARVPHGLADPRVVCVDLERAGLVLDGVEHLRVQGRSPSAGAVADGFCRGTPLRFALAQRGDLGELSAAVGELMTARLGEGPVVGELAAHVVTAHRAGHVVMTPRTTTPRPAAADRGVVGDGTTSRRSGPAS